MSFPKIEKPTYELTVPSTKQEISYIPYSVAEEKILLMALQGGDLKEIERAVKQIIKNCVITPNFKVDELKLYDVEYIFLKLRIASQGETVDLVFEPLKNTNCEECKKERKVSIDLTKAEVVYNEEHEEKIEFNKKTGVVMKSPDISMLALFEQAKTSDDVNDVFKVIWRCVDYIYDEENTYQASSSNLKDGIEWLEDLDIRHFRKLEKFFKTLPRISQTVEIKCSSCDFSTNYTMSGLESFFV